MPLPPAAVCRLLGVAGGALRDFLGSVSADSWTSLPWSSCALSPVVSTTIKAPIILRVRALHGSDVDVHRELGTGAWVSSDILGKKP